MIWKNNETHSIFLVSNPLSFKRRNVNIYLTRLCAPLHEDVLVKLVTQMVVTKINTLFFHHNFIRIANNQWYFRCNIVITSCYTLASKDFHVFLTNRFQAKVPFTPRQILGDTKSYLHPLKLGDKKREDWPEMG